jgi:hypothetical protein
MEQLSSASNVQKILGGKGKKLTAHEIHVRRTAEKGKFIARHILKDKDGNSPMDGQRGEAEYALNNPQELLDHMQQHMGDQEPDAQDPQETEPAQPGQ